eukprot:scaffold23925_cov157-Cylindrotheca_fusiformis.AAC.4
MSEGANDESQNLLLHGDAATAHTFAGLMPSTAPEPRAGDSLVARAMAACSGRVLEEAYDDVHGVAKAVEETPALVEKSLQGLEHELRLRKDSEAYLLAKEMDSSYVENREFRLMFLRADRFAVKAAALRIVRHFQVKLELFGKEKLALDITQDDLDEETMESLYAPIPRILRTRDRSGRVVSLWKVDRRTQAKPSLDAKLRRVFYAVTLAATSRPETQKSGLVVVMYFFKKPPSSFLQRSGALSVESFWKLSRFNACLPLHLSAVHFCNDSGAWTLMQAVAKIALSVFTRIRLRSHYGTSIEYADTLFETVGGLRSFEEVSAGLQSYGIQASSFPVEMGGNETTDEHRQWLEGQRMIERQTKPPRDRVLVPFRFDVLFGKGNPLQNHFGNIKLRQLIADCVKTYEKTGNGEKYLVVQAIVNTVKQSSGRFLKADDDSWIVVDDADAERKVSAHFRTLRFFKRGPKNVAKKTRRNRNNL